MVKNIWFWIIQFCCWLFIAFIALSFSPLQDSDTNSRIIFFLAYFFIGSTIGYMYCILVESINPDDITISQLLFYPFGGSFIIGFVFTIIDIFLGQFVFKNGVTDFFTLLFKNSWIVIPCFFFYHLYRFATIYQDRKQRTIVAENLLQISELENLKKQLNPHFLFNALNSIKALTLFDGEKARESIIQLSDLLRLSLNLGEQQRATLSEELRLAENYLALEKLRFDSRLSYEFKIDIELDNILIMPMSLNTLLENAVKHGIGQLKSGGKIITSASTENNLITITVENSGFFDPKPKSQDGGIGLENLHKRLELQFGKKASFTIENQNKMVVATIKMPF
jgi:two-component system LytT family sensor kinase